MTAAPSRRSRFAPSRAWLLPAGVILAAFFFSPVSAVMDTLLDSSNYSSYTYFAAHRFQYGPEVVPMSGPFGYVMYGSVYNGLLFWTRWGLQLACGAAFAAMLLWFFHRSRNSAWRWVWLALVVVFSPLMEDLQFEWMILLSGLFLLQRPPVAPPRRWILVVAAGLAFLSLIKGTHLVLSVATLGVVVVHHAAHRDWRRVALTIGGYLASFLIFWLIAGQDPLHIPSFLRGTLALTSGYNEAMSLDEAPITLAHGLAAAGLLALALAWGFWHRRNTPAMLATTLLFAGVSFVKWKHGFVRADGHIYIFHHYVTVAVVLWYLAAFAGPRGSDQPTGRRVALGLMLAGLVAGLWVEGAGQSVRRLAWLVETWHPARLKLVADQLLHPAAAKARFDRQLGEVRDIQVMSLTQQAVDRRSIDLFGIQHGIIPLNGLNYHPRPMGGGAFNAYNRYLMEANRDFIRDPARRPDFYLLRYETIDERLGTQDDGPTLIEILSHYRPTLIERGHLLLKLADEPQPAELQPLSRLTVHFGEFTQVPTVPDDQLLVARFTIAPTLLNRLRTFLYKAPLVFISIKGEGIQAPDSRRFIPGMVSNPFLFSPAIEDNSDLAYLYTRQPGKRVTGFTLFSTHPGQWQDPVTVEFFTTPRPPVPQKPDIEELLTSTRFPVFNVAPEKLTGDHLQQQHVQGLLLQTLHAPGEVIWRLDGSEEELVFDYGFMPEAVVRGSSDGARFIVELRPREGPARELFSRLVDPVHRAADRGNLHSRVALPAVRAGDRLVLRTDPGADGNNAWDWCYVTRVQLRAGYFPSKRFPVFNREPAAVEPVGAGPLLLGAAQVFILHLPGALTFNLDGSEQRLRLEFGFMPGAYTGQGRTDGGTIIVEVVHAGGAPREIFRRELRPVTVPQERGTLAADISLAGIAPGDQLLVRTAPVPGGGVAWGWTYFSRLVID